MAVDREYPRLSSAGRRAAAAAVPMGRRWRATALPCAAGLAALALLAAGCDPYVQGNGSYLEVDRTPGPFAGIHVDDGIQATASVAAGAPYTVRLSGDGNIVEEYVKAEVRPIAVDGDTVYVLHLWVEEPSGGYAPTIPIRAAVRSPSPAAPGEELRYFGVAKAARLEASEIAASHVDVAASDGAFLEVKGPAPLGATLHATFTGGHGELAAYPLSDAAVVLGGASNLELSVSGALTGEAGGSSVLTNVVAAATCAVTTSGNATVVCGPTPP